jgi:rifampicin phosphotransferase
MTMTHDNDKHEKLFYTFFHAGKIISGDEETVPSFPPLSQVGGKALSLIQATSLGFPVPRGFVLTVKYFEPWMKALMQQPAWTSFADQVERNDVTKEVCDAVKEACRRLFCDSSNTDRTMTVALQEAIDEVFDTITTEKSSQDALLVAVRSSSPEEDLTGSSFAGGYETTLGVPLLDDQKRQQALVESFVSMFDYRVVQYKLKMQQSASKNDVTYAVLHPRIAVVVQEQLRSSTSGVAFSMNPSNNCYDEITITANYGLGESVVSGIVTPDVYVVLNNNPEDEEINSDRFRIVDRKIGSKKESIWLASTNNEQGCKRWGTLQKSNSASTEPSLTDAQVLQVAELVAQVEQSYKKLQQSSLCPVDLEWAYQDEELYLLQARPVTTHIPLFPEMLTPRGSGKRNLYLDVIVMTQGFSEPFSVLGLDIWKTFLGLV